MDFRGQAEGIDSMISACTISAVELWANYLIYEMEKWRSTRAEEVVALVAEQVSWKLGLRWASEKAGPGREETGL